MNIDFVFLVLGFAVWKVHVLRHVVMWEMLPSIQLYLIFGK